LPALTPRLASAIRDSPAGRDCLPDGRGLLIIYDAKLDSELGPYGDACKTTSIRMQNFRRLIAALRCARGDADAEVLPKGDVLVVSHGFHNPEAHRILKIVSERAEGEAEQGLEADSHVTGNAKKKRAAAPPTTLKNLMVVHHEAVLAARRMRSSRGFMAVKQVETLLCISWSSLADLRARPNILHPGSTNGQVLSGVSASNVSRNVKLWCRGDSLLEKRPRLLPGYTTSHIAASEAKRRKKRDQSRLRVAAVQPKAWTCMCNLLWTCPAQAKPSGKRSAAAAASRELGE
jgi:hypothetical protein